MNNTMKCMLFMLLLVSLLSNSAHIWTAHTHKKKKTSLSLLHPNRTEQWAREKHRKNKTQNTPGCQFHLSSESGIDWYSSKSAVEILLLLRRITPTSCAVFACPLDSSENTQTTWRSSMHSKVTPPLNMLNTFEYQYSNMSWSWGTLTTMAGLMQ